MHCKSSGEVKTTVLAVLTALLFLSAFFLHPHGVHAIGDESPGIGSYTPLGDRSSENPGRKVDPLRNFTISEIEPNIENKSIEITFTEICNLNSLRRSLKVFPPVRLDWHDSRANANVVKIRGAFKAGQNYTIVISESATCRGRTYVPTVNTFRMPDLEPCIEFAEEGTIIERDSRQMLHAAVTNVDELVFEGLRIPPILVPMARATVRSQPSFEQSRDVLEQRYAVVKRHVANIGDLRDFMGDFAKDRQMFFPGQDRNKRQTFSIPLNFRKDKEKGSIEIISLEGRGGGKRVRSPIRIFRITDMGLTYKISDDSMLVWVTSLNTGRPMKNVSLLAFTKDSGVVPLGKTDRHGIRVIRDGEIRKHIDLKGAKAPAVTPLLLRDINLLGAASSNDCVFIEIKQNGNIKPDWVNQARTIGERGRLLRGHVFTERGIYRPGETVHFKGTVREYRDGEIAPPDEFEPSFRIMNSKDERVYEKKLKLSQFGTASDTFEIKPYFPLGTYTIHMKFSKEKDGTASRTFEVQEFRPPRHFAEVHCRHEKRKDERYINLDREMDLLVCDISGRYYAGGPVKHGKVRWKIYYKRTHFQAKGYEEFTFGNYIGRRTELLESGESILDEKGMLTVTIPMSRDVLSGVYGMEVVATVVDFDGRASTETAVYQERPDYLVGISPHKDTVKAGDSQVLQIIVVDRKDKTLKRGTLDVEVMEKVHTYVRKRNDRGDVYWEWKGVWRKQISAMLNIGDGKAIFDFDFIWGGEYLLKFTYNGKDGRSYSSSTMYHVHGAFYGYEYENRDRNFEKLSVIPDKTECSPGDTIRLYLNPHRRLSTVLMTIERDDILEYRILELPFDRKSIDIPVDKGFIPNVFISCLGTVARGDFPVYTGEFDDSAPAFLFGVVNVEVKKEVEDLEVTINEDETDLKSAPGAEVTLKLSVKDGFGKGVESEMAVGVVDESILALTGFSTPSLETLSRFISPLTVFTGELRAELLRQTPFGYVRNEPLTGGGGLEKRPEAVTSRVRRDFRPVAYFNPAVHTDRSGKAEVSFQLPDTMTTYRVYAVACDRGSRFASTQRGLLVVKDFYLEPGIPRFITRGDRFRFSVSAFNKTDGSGTVSLSIGKDNLVDLSAEDDTHPLKAFDRALLPVEGRAIKPGISKMVFSGRFEDKEDTLELKVPVNSGFLLWNDVVFGTMKNEATIPYDFPEGTDKIPWDELNPDDVRILLTVSGSPFLRMTKGFQYLLRFPYGCVEQTSSGVLPLAALRGLIEKGMIPDISVEQTDKFLQAGIERLFSMQTDSGGFGYWPGNIRPHRWGTIYATMALTHARRAGFEVSEERTTRAMVYLKDTIREVFNSDQTFNGFAAYILAMNGRLDNSLFKRIYREINRFPREGALLVLLAGKTGGYLSERELIGQTRAVLKRKWDRRRSDVFYARYREPAIALLAGAAILPNDPLTGRLAKGLLGGINKQGIWTSTSDTGWSLVALGEYFKGKFFADKPLHVDLRQTGVPGTTVLLDPKGSYTFVIEPKTFLKNPELILSADRDVDIVYMLSLTFPRLDYASEGYENRFKIHKSIENTDGSTIIKVGDVIKVRLTIDMEDYNYNYVVLDDPLPAGLVAINTAIKTEEYVGEKKAADAPYWSHWDHEGGFYRFVPNYFEMRDERVLVFRDRSWRGTYQYSYYARAVCEGEFVMPATKIQLMYEPDIVSYTPVEKVIIQGR